MEVEPQEEPSKTNEGHETKITSDQNDKPTGSESRTLVETMPVSSSSSEKESDSSGRSLAHATVFEKIVACFPLPYVFSILFVAMFIGPLGIFLFLLSLSGNAQNAFYATFGVTYSADSGFIQANYNSLVSNLTWYVFLFYAAFMTRRLRTRLVRAERDLAPLAPEGKKTLLNVFSIVSKTMPQLALASIFLVIYGTSVPDLVSTGQFTAFSAPIYILRSLLRSLMFGSVLWLCFASLWGLYKLGKLPLRLKPCFEDPMLGARELGALSFSFSSTYFGGLFLFAAQMILGEVAGHTASINLIVMPVLVPMGIVLFLAPLVSAHNRMVEVKKAELASTRKLFSHAVYSDTIETSNQNMIRLLMLEAAERKATSIRTWPVESPVVGKLMVITLSVSATMIARLIQILLHM